MARTTHTLAVQETDHSGPTITAETLTLLIHDALVEKAFTTFFT